MNKVILWGIGKIAQVINFYLTNDSNYEVCAFCVDKEYKNLDFFYNKPVISFDEIVEKFPPTHYLMCIPIGYKKMNTIRMQKYIEAKQKGYKFITYISSKTAYYGTPVGENTIILDDCVIQPFTEIGNNVIIWSGSCLCHHALVKDNCFISSRVSISGGTTIGENSFIGINATIRDNISIGKYNLIGAGTVVLNDTSDYDVYAEKNGTKKIPKKSIDVRNI